MGEKISRRDAIKKIGLVTAGAAAALSGAYAFAENNTTYNKKDMKVLLVNGSPHKDGCTNVALQEVGKALNGEGIETEVYWIGTKPLAGCLGCGACSNTGRCFMDDIVNEFLDKSKDFDGFVFGAPVHFFAIPGLMTSFMNRAFFAARAGHQFQGKVAGAVTSSRRAGSLTTLDQFNRYFVHGGMPIVPSQYPPMVFGGKAEDVLQDKEGLQIMRTLGRNMAWMLKNKDLGEQSGLLFPEREERISTNFIR